MSSTLAVNQLLHSVVSAENGPAGIVFGAIDKHGNVLCRSAAGVRKLGGSELMTPDTVFPIFSCTKMITGIACMRLVEEGKLDLDAPVDAILPEVASAMILNKDGSKTKPQTKITLRMLLSHTAGYSYTFYSEGLKKWGEDHNLSEFQGSQASVDQPLVVEPGTEFNYGVNIDWAGIAVERVTGMSLGAYCKQIIFDPLGLTDTAFEAPSGEQLTRFASLHARAPDETLTAREHFEFSTGKGKGFHSGGGGLHSTLDDYLKVLTVLINKGVGAGGVRVLKAETVAAMFADQVSHLAPEKCLDKPNVVSIPHLAGATSVIFEGFEKGWGLTFLLIKSEFPTGRSPGSGTWAGLANLFWTADPVKGIANFILSSSLPYGDMRIINAWLGAEGTVYAHQAAQAVSA